jgi:branched-chain amino acid transport system ATP-binding protein
LGISARAIRAGYEAGIEILQGVDVDVFEGQVVAVIGPNGAGKSTLLKTIFGLLDPWGGTLTFRGSSLVGMPLRKRVRAGICYVPQEDSLFLRMSVADNLALAGRMATAEPGAKLKLRTREVLAHFPSLEGREHDLVNLLSGGQRKLVEFGRALMTKPRLLLLDEPTAGLSPKAAEEIYGHIVRLKNSGMSILLVDQNVKQALEISNYVYLVDMGRNRHEGTPDCFSNYLSRGLSAWTNTNLSQREG